MKIDLKQGDCLELMKELPDESIDMILCDLPYGTTANGWDKIIDFKQLWQQYERIIKKNGIISLFGQEPFSSKLRLSAPKKCKFRYDWIWEKTKAQGFLLANKMPLRVHESISIFYKHLPKYNPQFTQGKPYINRRKPIEKNNNYGNLNRIDTINKTGKRYPRDVLKFSNANHNYLHPTQKPIPLLKYLIKTYTNENDTVLDNCMGSGSTGVACVNTNRNFIGYELDQHYFDIAKKRIDEALHKVSC